MELGVELELDNYIQINHVHITSEFSPSSESTRSLKQQSVKESCRRHDFFSRI